MKCEVTLTGALRQKTVLAVTLVSMVALGGCATSPDANPRDPWEPFNRSVYEFNDAVDSAVMKPIAEAYSEVTPDLIRTHISNFFGNLGDAWSFVNAALQARPREAAENLMRFNLNTFLGFGGIVDIASEMGIERTKLDFGQTLGRWGVPAGPYVVLPLWGPSSVRDAAGITIESRGDLIMGIDHIPSRNTLYTLRVVEKRANLLRATNMLEGVALDKYSFTRDAYLQRRDSQIENIIDEAPHLRDFRVPASELSSGDTESSN